MQIKLPHLLILCLVELLAIITCAQSKLKTVSGSQLYGNSIIQPNATVNGSNVYCGYVGNAVVVGSNIWGCAEIQDGAKVYGSNIFEGAVIQSNAVVYGSNVYKGALIKSGANVTGQNVWAYSVIESNGTYSVQGTLADPGNGNTQCQANWQYNVSSSSNTCGANFSSGPLPPNGYFLGSNQFGDAILQPGSQVASSNVACGYIGKAVVTTSNVFTCAVIQDYAKVLTSNIFQGAVIESNATVIGCNIYQGARVKSGAYLVSMNVAAYTVVAGNGTVISMGTGNYQGSIATTQCYANWMYGPTSPNNTCAPPATIAYTSPSSGVGVKNELHLALIVLVVGMVVLRYTCM